MFARQIDSDVQILLCLVVAALRGETHSSVLGAHVDRAYLRVFAEAISRHRLGDARQNFAHVGIVQAQHRPAVERQMFDKVYKRLFETLEIMAIGFHMVGIYIGDHREYRQQMQKGRV